MDEDNELIRIILSGITNNKEDALKFVEVFSRMLVGLAFDGLDVSLDVSVLHEYEPEFEDIEGGEEEL